MIKRFSRKYNYSPGSEEIICEDAPERLRARFWNLVKSYVNTERLPGYDILCEKYTDFFGKVVYEAEFTASKEVQEYILKRPWYEFYDLCEYTFGLLQELYPKEYGDGYFAGEKLSEVRYKYTVDLNHIFQDEQIGWRLRKGQIERTSSEYLDKEVIDKAWQLLQNPKFVGPNTQFQKSIKFFSQRPKPDIQNTIKEAVGALEAVAKIVENDKKADLGKLIPIFVEKGILKKPLDKCFTSIYAFRGDQPGVAHGEYEISELDIADAELILNLCAAGIVFLGKKYEIQVKEVAETKEDFPF